VVDPAAVAWVVVGVLVLVLEEVLALEGAMGSLRVVA